VADPLLCVENLVLRFGGIVATDHVSLDVARGELHAIIGPNGAGKTTLISQLTGQLVPHAGTVRLAGRDITRVPAYRRRRRRPMTGIRSGSGAMPARKAACAMSHWRPWTGSGWALAPTPWYRN
jgi:ABC-type multidrug transport system ATPase subunit